MEIPVHIAAVREEGALMAAAVAQADPDSAVPTCPEWTVRDLGRHLGGVHRWATGFVRGRTEPQRADLDEVVGTWPADAELAGWLAQGCADLVARSRRRPTTLECWTFLPAPSPRAMWARRQAHETAIHRVDAQLAAGLPALTLRAGLCRRRHRRAPVAVRPPRAAQRCAPIRRSHWRCVAPMSTPRGCYAWTSTASPPRLPRAATGTARVHGDRAGGRSLPGAVEPRRFGTAERRRRARRAGRFSEGVRIRWS